VVVLGYRNPQPTANFINRWRVRAGLRSVAADRARETVVIFSGGATGSHAVEAQLMADYAKSVLGFDGTVLLEDQSATTWENISNVIPLLENVDRIKIASQPAHALKARAYVRRQRPDLAERLVRADDYRPGEWAIGKPLLALYGLWTLRGLKPEERASRSRPGPWRCLFGGKRCPAPAEGADGGVEDAHGENAEGGGGEGGRRVLGRTGRHGQEHGDDVHRPAGDQVDQGAIAEGGGEPFLGDALDEVRGGVGGEDSGQEAENHGQHADTSSGVRVKPRTVS
jgi:hypothetical protein